MRLAKHDQRFAATITDDFARQAIYFGENRTTISRTKSYATKKRKKTIRMILTKARAHSQIVTVTGMRLLKTAKCMSSVRTY